MHIRKRTNKYSLGACFYNNISKSKLNGHESFMSACSSIISSKAKIKTDTPMRILHFFAIHNLHNTCIFFSKPQTMLPFVKISALSLLLSRVAAQGGKPSDIVGFEPLTDVRDQVR